ncbi:MAG: 16S rRNA (guanine(527)-N(7))-methyltransferase RsmG [bacterium]
MYQLEELFKQGTKELGIALNDAQLKLFSIYLKIIKDYNQKVNITGIKTSDGIIVNHFLDSLTCALGFCPINEMKIIDVGTGAGFPGIPLKICYPQVNLILLDSKGKYVEFLYQLKNHLGIKFEILQGRAEEFGNKEEYRQRYDLVVSRAVAKLNTLVEYTLPFLKIGGLFISQKGSFLQDELIYAQKAIDILGGRIKEQKRITLPIVHQERNLVIIEKIKPTPVEYPRRVGVPERKPIT